MSLVNKKTNYKGKTLDSTKRPFPITVFCVCQTNSVLKYGSVSFDFEESFQSKLFEYQ